MLGAGQPKVFPQQVEKNTIRLNDAAMTERVVALDKIDRARTVFVWGPAPKPGKTSDAKKKPAGRISS